MTTTSGETKSEQANFGKGYQAEIQLGTYQGQKAFLKSISHPDLPLVNRVEQWVLEREARALRTLERVSAVPGFLGYPEPDTIAMEFRAGTTLRDFDSDRLTPTFFEELEEVVREIHRRGLVHSDLKKKENILVDESHHPVIVDFGTTFRKLPWYRPLGNFLYDQFHQMDLNAVSKLKRQLCPEALTDEDRERLSNPTILERLDRWRRNYVWDW